MASSKDIFFHPCIDDSIRQVQLITPFGQWLFIAIKFNPQCIAPISTLFALSSPPAIARLIVPVHVDSINRQPIFVPTGQSPLTKSFVGLPVVADLNASTTVIFEGILDVIVCAPRVKGGPNSVQAALAFTMSSASIPDSLPCKTSARASVSHPQVVALQDDLFPAVASAKPVRGSCFIHMRKAKDKQTTESLSSQINSRHSTTPSVD